MAADFNAMLRVVPEYHTADTDSPFAPPENHGVLNEKSNRQEIDLRYQQGGIQAQILLRNIIRRGRAPENDFILNTLYWDTAWRDQDFSIGKKVMSWGVGFGFRPLDVLQKENRRRLDNEALEGLPLLAWEKFSATTASSLVLANPHREKEEKSKDDVSLTLKIYQLQAAMDLHGLLRLSERHDWEAGAGISHVIGTQFAWHTSLLYQRRYQRWLNPLAGASSFPLAAADPLQQINFEHGLKAIGGTSWTHASGWSVLSEVWYDDQAYSRDQWRDLTALTAKQRRFLDDIPNDAIPNEAIFSNIAASSRYFQTRNLLRWNTFLRLSYAGEDFDPSLDILYTPEDKGHVVTFKVNYEGEKHQLSAALRRFGGPEDAAYQLLPKKWIFWIGWEWAFYSEWNQQ